MRGLTAGAGSLLDLIDMPDDQYNATRVEGTSLVKSPQIFAGAGRGAPYRALGVCQATTSSATLCCG